MVVSLGEVRQARKAMRELGATGPATARSASDLPARVRSELGRYVDEGIIREGPAGTFYLDEGRASAVFRNGILKAVIFWFLVILLPVAILQVSNSRLAP